MTPYTPYMEIKSRVIASVAKQSLCIFVLFAFLINTFSFLPLAQADEFRLPVPGVMVHLSPPLDPPMLKGIKVHPDNPFLFDFILDKGDSELSNDQLKDESSKLIKYFLASLTIPENDLWVNLSPYEKDRIIPQSFGLTEMGRDLLAEDYMLKQITASLIYPEDQLGKRFWKRVYEEAARKYGTTNVPVNTFNKVWIVPEKAVVYENAKAGTAYVVESKLKVMLEQDYLSLQKHIDVGAGSKPAPKKDGLEPSSTIMNQLGSQVVREIVIPELTKEVNENKNFSQLRQVYNSLILATWYKMKIRDSILEQVYANKNKIAGVNNRDPREKEKIYQRYLMAFKKGVYNYIKEESDPTTQEVIPRKYFSGGFALIKMRRAIQLTSSNAMISSKIFSGRTLLRIAVAVSVAGALTLGALYWSEKSGNRVRNLNEVQGQTVEAHRMAKQEGIMPNAQVGLSKGVFEKFPIEEFSDSVRYPRAHIVLKAEKGVTLDVHRGVLPQFRDIYIDVINGLIKVGFTQKDLDLLPLTITSMYRPKDYQDQLFRDGKYPAAQALDSLHVFAAAIDFKPMDPSKSKDPQKARIFHNIFVQVLQKHEQLGVIGVIGEGRDGSYSQMLGFNNYDRPIIHVGFFLKENQAMMTKTILNAYIKGPLQKDHSIATYLKSKNIDPQALGSAIEEAGKDVLRAKLKDPNHSLIRFAKGMHAVVYKGTVEGNDIIVKNVGASSIWSKYDDYQDRLGHYGSTLVAGYLVLKDLDIYVDGHIERISNAIVQEEVEPLLDRVRYLRKTYQNNPKVLHQEINNLLNDYFELYKKLLSQGLVMKPNGFLVDVGVTKGSNRVVVLDVGDLLTKEEASEDYDLDHFNESFILALKGDTIFSKGTPSHGFQAEAVDTVAELGTTLKDFNYSIVQSANRDFADGKVLGILAQNPKRSREIYFGNHKISKEIRDARLEVIRRRISGEETGAPPVSNAQLARKPLVQTRREGGINLTPANMNLQTLNGGQAIKFHMNAAMLAQLKNAPGFMPVIINIQPMTDLRLFLGINDKEAPIAAG